MYRLHSGTGCLDEMTEGRNWLSGFYAYAGKAFGTGGDCQAIIVSVSSVHRGGAKFFISNLGKRSILRDHSERQIVLVPTLLQENPLTKP